MGLRAPSDLPQTELDRRVSPPYCGQPRQTSTDWMEWAGAAILYPDRTMSSTFRGCQMRAKWQYRTDAQSGWAHSGHLVRPDGTPPARQSLASRTNATPNILDPFFHALLRSSDRGQRIFAGSSVDANMPEPADSQQLW